MNDEIIYKMLPVAFSSEQYNKMSDLLGIVFNSNVVHTNNSFIVNSSIFNKDVVFYSFCLQLLHELSEEDFLILSFEFFESTDKTKIVTEILDLIFELIQNKPF